MTVIVGLKANTEEGLVIAADRAYLMGDPNMVHHLRQLAYNGVRFSSFLKFLKEKKLDKVRVELGKKIEISKDGKSVLAHTGVDNDAHKRVRDFFLNPDAFFADEAFIREMLFPFEVQGKLSDGMLEAYKARFDLAARIAQGYIPEVRRISDLQVVRKTEVKREWGNLVYFDRNFNSKLSEYILGKVLQGKTFVLDVALTGAIVSANYVTNGCGGNLALDYLKEQLGTREFFEGGFKIEKRIGLREAVEIATGAVKYACSKDKFCSGLDYVILTPDGAEPHFDRQKGRKVMDLADIAEGRVKDLQEEISRLKRVKMLLRKAN